MIEGELDKKVLDEINAGLDEFEKKLGLPDWKEEEAPKYLSMHIDDLRKKTPDELSEAVFLLNRYAWNIQRAINRSRVWERWANVKLDEVASSVFKDINANGWQERMMIAKHGPELCKRLQKFLFNVHARLDRLAGTPDQIRVIADSIRDMKFAAIRREKNDQRSE